MCKEDVVREIIYIAHDMHQQSKHGFLREKYHTVVKLTPQALFLIS